MKLHFNEDGFVTEVTSNEGIDEYMLGTLHTLQLCDSLVYDEAVAFMGTIIEAVSKKYNKLDTTLLMDLTTRSVRKTSEEVEEFIKQCQ